MLFKKVLYTIYLGSNDILDARQNFKLSLRKRNLDDYILKKREKAFEITLEHSRLEIKPENLNLSADVLNKSLTDYVKLYY